MKKTYEANTTQSYMMLLNLRGKPHTIKFDEGRARPVELRCRFTTNDADLQLAIEATRQFKREEIKIISTIGEILSDGIDNVADGDRAKHVAPQIVAKPTTKIDPATEVNPPETKESKKPEPKHKELKAENIQKVAEYLENYRGADPKDLKTPDDIKKVAKEQNVTYPYVK